MNTMKKSMYAVVGVGAVGFMAVQNIAWASDPFRRGSDAQNINISKGPAETGVQTIIDWVIGFLYLLAVCYALYGGFLILTAGGEDDKVTKGKTILIQGGIGLLVIWLAGTIVDWILRAITSAS